MTSRAHMVHRATVERDSNAATPDAYDGDVIPAWAALATVPCFASSKVRRAVVDGEKTAAIEDLRAMFPLAADVKEADRIANITDRKGVVIIAGPLAIETITRHHRHVEAMLRRIG